MPEQRQQNDDRQGHAEKPKQNSASETHDAPLLRRWSCSNAHDNVEAAIAVPDAGTSRNARFRACEARLRDAERARPRRSGDRNNSAVGVIYLTDRRHTSPRLTNERAEGEPMTDVRAADVSIIAAEDDIIEPIIAADSSAINWAAVVAGAFANAALTLMLMGFGAGMGFSAISPWANSGVSMTTFSVGTGIYLIVMAMLASTIGGYLAGRLRTRWTAVHTDEVFFRDTAHGFVAWACAAVLSAAVLGAGGTAIVSGATAGITQRAPNDGGPAAIYVDEMFRPAAGAPAASPGASQANADAATRAEVARLLLRNFRDRTGPSAADRAYLAQLVASRTGLSQADADKRVNDVLAQAKQDLDKARGAAAKLALWLTAALLAGALASSLAAIEGGELRDRRFATP
jgi:hypothetical protein